MGSRNGSGEVGNTNGRSRIWLSYRRVVGTTRLFVQAGIPWRLLSRGRVARLVGDLRDAVGGWEGVSPEEHRFGGTEFRYDGRELGHVHDWGLVDLPLARPLAEAVTECSLAHPHHVLPDSGWVSTFLRTDSDLDRILSLFGASYVWTLQAETGDPQAERVASLSVPPGVEEVLAEHGRTVASTD